MALRAKSTEAICEGVRPAANAFAFSVTRSHRLGCVEAGLQMMEKIRVCAGRFHLTSSWPSILFAELTNAVSVCYEENFYLPHGHLFCDDLWLPKGRFGR